MALGGEAERERRLEHGADLVQVGEVGVGERPHDGPRVRPQRDEPPPSRTLSASRTGMRLTPNPAARSRSTRREPGSRTPSRISSRSRDATRADSSTRSSAPATRRFSHRPGAVESPRGPCEGGRDRVERGSSDDEHHPYPRPPGPQPGRRARVAGATALAAAIALAAPAAAVAPAAAPADDGYEVILDGTQESFDAWEYAGDGGFDRLDDGTVRSRAGAGGGFGTLWYPVRQYGDFSMVVEYRDDAPATRARTAGSRCGSPTCPGRSRAAPRRSTATRRATCRGSR